ncbi:MAG: PilN domain-containing protein [Candidatus Binatia bacterium]
MSSKTLAISVHPGRICGAVLESSIGSLQVRDLFDFATSPESAPRLPVAGPFDRVVATVAGDVAVFRILDLPFRDRRRISQAVGPALEEHVPWSLDDGVLAWDVASSSSTAAGSGALAALAEDSRLAAARAALADLGVEPTPQKLVWNPSAVLSAYRRALGEDATFTAVDLGDGGAVVARFEGGQLLALRVLSPAGDELLVRNVAWSLSAMAGDQGRVVFGGRHAARLSSAIARGVPGLRVEELPVAAPVDGFGGRDWRETTSLAGLLLVAGGDAPAPVIDFEGGAGSLFGLPAWRELQGEARPLLRWGAAAAVLAVLAVGVDYVNLYAEHRVLAGRADKIYATAMPAGSGGAGRKLKMEMRLRELSGKAEAAAAGGAGSPLALLAALSREVPKNLEVVVDQVDHSPPSAKVAGHAASFETVTKMQQALARSGAFARVEVKDVHAAVTGSGVEFLLDLQTTPAEGGA